MELNFSKLKKAKSLGIEHEMVEITFQLPEGDEICGDFKVGQTVEVLKSFVTEKTKIPMEDQRLYLDGKLMFDPLSLSDFKDITEKGSAQVSVIDLQKPE